MLRTRATSGSLCWIGETSEGTNKVIERRHKGHLHGCSGDPWSQTSIIHLPTIQGSRKCSELHRWTCPFLLFKYFTNKSHKRDIKTTSKQNFVFQHSKSSCISHDLMQFLHNKFPKLKRRPWSSFSDPKTR